MGSGKRSGSRARTDSGRVGARAGLRNRFIFATPLQQTTIVAGCATLILWGCYCIRDGTSWFQQAPDEPPPRVELDRLIRVRFAGRSASGPIQLRVSSACRIFDTKSGRLLKDSPQPLAASPLSTAGKSIKLGDEILTSKDVTIKPAHDATIVVNSDTYRGELRVHLDGRNIRLTNHVDLESYLRGVLRGELPGNFHAEAFKAQCVAARTYAMYQKLGTPPGRDWDVVDTEGSQMYIGVRGEETKSDAAVAATAGEIAVYERAGQDKIFCTYYSSTCGGVTQPISQFKPNDPDVPPLAGNVVCTDCYLSRYYRWGPVKLTQDEVTARIVARYPSVKRLGKIVRLRPKEIGRDGRIVRVQLDGATGQNETLVGEDFRLCMGGHVVRSTNFTLESGPTAYVFRDGKGFGHGCGLCQFGAETKALRGMNYREILTFYYPTSQIKKLY